MTTETIFKDGLEISSEPIVPESGNGATTYRVGEHEIALGWKDGQVETADAQDSGLETKVFRLGPVSASGDAADGADGGIEEACIKCWRVRGGPWRCIPIMCPPTI